MLSVTKAHSSVNRQKNSFLLSKYLDLKAVFRIRIQIRSDPYHWPVSGSGSVSGNVDLDPGTKKNRDKLAYKSTKIIKV